jgi:hypothetical protein
MAISRTSYLIWMLLIVMALVFLMAVAGCDKTRVIVAKDVDITLTLSTPWGSQNMNVSSSGGSEGNPFVLVSVDPNVDPSTVKPIVEEATRAWVTLQEAPKNAPEANRTPSQ